MAPPAAYALRTTGVTLGVGLLSMGALLILVLFILGQGLGGVVGAIAGHVPAAPMSGGAATTVVLLVFGGQFGLSRFVSRLVAPPARRREAGRLAIALSALLCLIPVVGFVIVARRAASDSAQAQGRYQQALQQQEAEERRRAAALSDEMQKRKKIEVLERAKEETRMPELKDKLKPR